MSFKKALLSSVVLAGLAQGAIAAQLSNISVGAVGIGTETYNLASEVAFSTSAPTGTLVFSINPTAGNLPSGNFLLNVTLNNGAFASALSGSSVVPFGDATATAATSVLSSGGNAGSSSAVFVLSGAQTMNTTTEGFQVTVPFRATGGNVGVVAGFTTTDSPPVQIDGTAVTRNAVVSLVSAFTPAVAADTVTTQLTLASGFRTFSATSADAILGRVVAAQSTATVYRNLAGAAVASGDVSAVTVTVTGDFTGFGTASGSASLILDTDGDGSGTGSAFSVSGSTATITVTGGAAFTVASTNTAAPQIRVNQGTGASAAALNAAAYSATISATYANGSDYATAAEAASGAIQSITREGTSLIFPWTASQNTANLSGSVNIIRIGNTGTTAISGVFARVRSSSNASYTNPGLVNLNLTIPAAGEVVITSSSLQAALGDFGRGDVEITIEAPSSQLTTRRLVQRPDGVFDFSQGRQSQ